METVFGDRRCRADGFGPKVMSSQALRTRSRQVEAAAGEPDDRAADESAVGNKEIAEDCNAR